MCCSTLGIEQRICRGGRRGRDVCGAQDVRLTPMAAAARYEAATAGDLVAALQQRDELAWSEVLRRYAGRVTATVRTFRLSEADSQDAIQNTRDGRVGRAGGMNPQPGAAWHGTWAASDMACPARGPPKR